MPCYYGINLLVPLECNLGIVSLPSFVWDYPFFGEKLKRTVTPVNKEILQNSKFDFIIAIKEALDRDKELETFIKNEYIKVKDLALNEWRDSGYYNYKWVLYSKK